MAKKAGKKRTKKAPSQAQVVARLRATAAETQADPKKFKAAAQHTEKYTGSKDFNWDRKAPDGIVVHYFHTVGESLTGIIGQSQRASFMRGKRVDYEHLIPIVLDDDTLLYLPNNKHLREIIKKADCWFQRVTVTYEGKKPTAHGHYIKVYSVTPAPLGKDGLGAAGIKTIRRAANKSKGNTRT